MVWGFPAHAEFWYRCLSGVARSILGICALDGSPRFETWVCKSEIPCAPWKQLLRGKQKSCVVCFDFCLQMNKIHKWEETKKGGVQLCSFLIGNFRCLCSNVKNSYISPNFLQWFHPVKFTWKCHCFLGSLLLKIIKHSLCNSNWSNLV